MSSSRPLVQLPMTTWSMATPSLSLAVWVFSGRWGQETVGSMAERSMWMVFSYSASGSAS